MGKNTNHPIVDMRAGSLQIHWYSKTFYNNKIMYIYLSAIVNIMYRYVFIVFSTVAMLSCRQAATLTESEQRQVTEDVQQTLNNYYSDIKKSGLTAEFKYLDSSKDFFWVPPGFSKAISFDSVASILKQNAPMYISIDNSFDELRIIPLSRELATYTGRIHSAMTDTSGKVLSLSLIETGVLINRKDGWKLLNGQTTILDQ